MIRVLSIVDIVLIPIILLLVAVSLLAACSGQFPNPPTAKIGDATLTVKITTDSTKPMPQGAHIILSIVSVGEEEEMGEPLAGGHLLLSQSDHAVQIALPIDKKQISSCAHQKKCAVTVHVVRGNQRLFGTRRPVPYRLGQNSVTVLLVE